MQWPFYVANQVSASDTDYGEAGTKVIRLPESANPS